MSLGLPLPASGSAAVSVAFATALLASISVKLWLAGRQSSWVARNRSSVPAPFDRSIPLSAHQRAADYTLARTRLGAVEAVWGAAIRVGLTLLGGIGFIDHALRALLPQSPLIQQMLVVVAVVSLLGLLDLPTAWYRQFVLERRFGFNRMTPGLFLSDALKGWAVSVGLGLPVLGAVLLLMEQGGPLWWIWAWSVWMGFTVVLIWLYPRILAPLFNRFTPLEKGEVRRRVEALLQRCGFTSQGVFVMDGSRRSAHGNAYFTGLGRTKRIVFFDTLLSRLDVDEVEAVLAHELGHFRCRHVLRRLLLNAVLSLAGLGLVSWLMGQPAFFQGLGVTTAPGDANGGLALLLYGITLPVFAFLLTPIGRWVSRQQEFEADAYAARVTPPAHLARALVKLYQDNAATLTPDPLHSAFYDSHPPAGARLSRLGEFGVPHSPPGTALG